MSKLDILVERFSVNFQHHWIFEPDDRDKIADAAREEIESALNVEANITLGSEFGHIDLVCFDTPEPHEIENLARDAFAIVDEVAANFEDDDDGA